MMKFLHGDIKKYWPIFCWMWSVTKGYRGSITVCSIASIFRVMLAWAFIWVSKSAVDIATGDKSGNLIVMLCCLPVIMLLQITVRSVNNWLGELRNVRMNNDLVQKLFRHTLDSEWRGIEKYHTGDVVNRIESDASAVVSFATDTVPDLFLLLFELCGSFIFLWTLDSDLAWVLLGVSPVFFLVGKLYAKRMHRITKEVRESDSAIQSQIQESLQYRSVIKTLEQSDVTIGRLVQTMNLLVGYVRRRAKLSIISNGFVSLGFGTSYAVTFSWGVWQISRGIISYGTMTAFLQLAARVQGPILELGQQLPIFVRSFTAAERLLDLLHLPLEPKSEHTLLDGTLGVQLDNVCFDYEGGEPRSVFHDFNFDFQPGTTTAILGETGVGKTTLIRLLLALIRPTQGKVIIYKENGEKTKENGEIACTKQEFWHELDASSRHYFAYVPQGNTLLSGTIRSNLLMGNPLANEEQMHEALHLASADFVNKLPKGLDTCCGEGGGGLSEGQAQRITIARALLRPAPILLLDEATSALDPDTEKLVMQRITQHIKGKTVIMVTHRPAAADMCNRVLRL